jgi:hypothetical protein
MPTFASAFSRSSSPRLVVWSIALALGAMSAATAHAQGSVTFGGSATTDNKGNATAPAPPASPSAPAASPAASAVPAAAAPLPADAAAASAPAADASEAQTDAVWAARDRQINEADTRTGGSGLLHTQHAQTGAPGQFRLGFNTEWFSAGFLCTDAFKCPPKPGTTKPIVSDTMNHIGATVTLGVTLAQLGPGALEMYASTSAVANSDDANVPSLLQVLGDTDFGAKWDIALSKVFYLAPLAELWLINGTGAVGLDGSGTSALV